jgi:hypothetical protein
VLNFIKTRRFIFFLAVSIINFKKTAMKTILFLFSIIFLSSCTVYHYTTVESKSIKKNEQAVFAEENDTLRIEYNFSGRSGPVAIRIVNKTALPLYVDWKRSSIIVNDKAVSYFNPDGRIDGTISSQSIQLTNQVSAGGAAVHADLRLQPGSSFIPPHTYSQNTYVYLSSFVNPRVPIEQMQREKLLIDKLEYNLRKINFSETTTPLFFKSYITFMLGDNGGQSFTKQHDFYVGSFTKASLKPEDRFGNRIPGNTFFISNPSGVGTFVGVTAILGGITLAAIAAPDNTQQ